MTDVIENKRLNDEELEAVAGGVTPPTMDPTLLAAHSIQSSLSTALAMAAGGAHPVDTHTPADTGTSAPSVTIPKVTIAPSHADSAAPHSQPHKLFVPF